MTRESVSPAAFTDWLTALEVRHLANLRFPEVTRALRALSSAYVERRHKVSDGATLDSSGKRAAFALFYGPLHFLTLSHIVAAAGVRVPSSVLDLGCGTGAAASAWATSSATRARVFGIDRHPWAVEEARWTYRFFALDGTARVGDVSRLPPLERHGGIIAAYLMNELPDAVRLKVEEQMLTAARLGTAVLVIEPIARTITPWWNASADRFIAAGGRADEWRFPVTPPEALLRFGRAAGLRHTELTARTLMVNT